MRRTLLLTLLLACPSYAAFAQSTFDLEQEAAYFLNEALENSLAAVQNINLYAELAAGRDPDDQEMRLSMISLAVASASRAAAFFEVYDVLLARSGAQPPPAVAEHITALATTMLLVPEAAGEALAAETAGDVPVDEIRDRVQQMDEQLGPHIEALANHTGAVSASSSSLIIELTRWRNDLQRHLEGDADELAVLLARITNNSDVQEEEITELAYQAGRLESAAAALQVVEETLGQEDIMREDVLEDFIRTLREIGNEVAEDLVGLTDAERQEVVDRHTDEVLEILGTLRAGAWRTDR